MAYEDSSDSPIAAPINRTATPAAPVPGAIEDCTADDAGDAFIIVGVKPPPPPDR